MITGETELCKLAFKYGSDKCRRLKKHTYTEYYYRLLWTRKMAVKKVLEIGTGPGRSLLMWRDFFPNAVIYGADNQSRFLMHRNRIWSYLCDQSSGADLIKLIKKTGTDIDLIIDDGSHRPEDQVFTCKYLMPLLKKDCIYVIEDVADPSIIDKLRGYAIEVPTLSHLRRYDNRLVVVRHKNVSNISFFAKKPFRARNYGHLQRISSMIRGEQIAERIGAKLNPAEGYQNDVCIYVKPSYRPGWGDFLFEGKAYLDIVDQAGFIPLLKKHPEVGVLSLSEWNYTLLKKMLPANKIINIPQQHCNFERFKRKRSKVTIVGMLAHHNAFRYLPPALRDEITKRGMKFVEVPLFYTRQDIINFFMNIDIQIVWRPFNDYTQEVLTNPLKIVNASSFGIPTIALNEPAFAEVAGCYAPVQTFPEFLTELDNLRGSPNLYTEYTERCLKIAEDYHIEKIAELYKDLT